MITVDAEEAKQQWSTLLSAVEDWNETVVICRDGKPVAELRATRVDMAGHDPLKTYPELAVTLLYDPMEPATEDEWPSEFR
jgi:antitoxin (DNA-binding transcriptional repressor) of toxin-antitoxin stability system